MVRRSGWAGTGEVLNESGPREALRSRPPLRHSREGGNQKGSGIRPRCGLALLQFRASHCRAPLWMSLCRVAWCHAGFPPSGE